MTITELIDVLNDALHTSGDLEVYVFNDEFGDYGDVTYPGVENIHGRGRNTVNPFTVQ